MTGLYVLGAVWIVCLIAGAMLGSLRGSVAAGFLWPLVLGPIGLLVSWWLLKDEDEPQVSPGP